MQIIVVVPLFSLVWYNEIVKSNVEKNVVVPLFSLVWYNAIKLWNKRVDVVVPLFSLVWYNVRDKFGLVKRKKGNIQ